MTEIPNIIEAKRQLGIDRFALQVHDASFPMDPEEDLGRGSPYSHGAERFFRFAANLGFDAIQLGPRGMTGRGNPSPYDGTIFSRNPLDLPLLRLVQQGRLSRKTFESLRASLPLSEANSVPYSLVFDAYQNALAEIIENATESDRMSAGEFLSKNESWLVPDALYAALGVEHGSESWYEWSSTAQGTFDQRLFHPIFGQERAGTERLAELRSRSAKRIEDYALIQWLLHEQHQALRARLAELNLAVFGDLQVGMSLRDSWAWQHLFLPGYRIGAPPSRTNPSGQPWGYSVFDPDQWGTLEAPGPALKFVQARVGKVLSECDGLRIDHPHGWVDPWVYRADDPDPFHAVQNGARLYSSPDNSQHPLLSKYAIARPEQIDLSQPGYADHHVTSLEDSQVAKYSLLFDTIRTLQAEHGRPQVVVACEVLSTLPYQLGRALIRHHMGRFRVTQKLKHDDPTDVYRIEHAAPQDWIMLGTHDTPPIWQLAQRWCRGSEGAAWGQYLARILVSEAEQSSVGTGIAESPSELVHSLFAAMLSSRARHVVVFFPDLFGMTERYNEPGIVNQANWSLRLPTNFEEIYERRCASGDALNVGHCFRRALEASHASAG